MKMKWENHGIKTPLARARGLGSAKEGVEHWTMQRITAIANIPLVIWFILSIIHLIGADYQTFTSWQAQPTNAILMVLFILSTFYHASLGLQVIYEDYIHHEGFKFIKIIGMKLFFFGVGVASIFSVLKIAFTAGV